MKQKILLAVCLTALFAINSVIGQPYTVTTPGGTSGYIPVWNSAFQPPVVSIGTSIIYDNGGNIGIGTTNPLHTLHIYNGDFFVGTSTSDNFVHINKNWCGLELKNIAYTPNLVRPVDFKVTAANGCGRFISDYSVAMFLDCKDTVHADDTARFVILADEDHWGNNAKLLFVVDQHRTFATEEFWVSIPGNDNEVLPSVQTVVEEDADYNFIDSYERDLKINYNSTKEVFIYDTVTVGSKIKMYGSQGNLWVGHEIQINATNPWGDFVFDPNYKLKSLSEVEAYIKANKHLEGIPSATEVETNGIQVGEMTTILTQKIEELTLYTIELQKQVDALKKQLDNK